MVPGRNIAGAGLVGKGMRGRSLGVLFATTTAVTWGGQFVVGKSALETVNAFPLSTERYTMQMPGNHGGSNFGSAAVDPEHGVVYVVSKD